MTWHDSAVVAIVLVSAMLIGNFAAQNSPESAITWARD